MPCAGLGALGKQTLCPLASVMTQVSTWQEQHADIEEVCAPWVWREAPATPGRLGTSAAICQAAGSLGAWPWLCPFSNPCSLLPGFQARPLGFQMGRQKDSRTEEVAWGPKERSVVS